MLILFKRAATICSYSKHHIFLVYLSFPFILIPLSLCAILLLLYMYVFFVTKIFIVQNPCLAFCISLLYFSSFLGEKDKEKYKTHFIIIYKYNIIHEGLQRSFTIRLTIFCCIFAVILFTDFNDTSVIFSVSSIQTTLSKYSNHIQFFGIYIILAPKIHAYTMCYNFSNRN